jgi:arabinose-5-phosphate isomerase
LAVALMKKRNFQPEHFAAFHPGGSLGRRLLTKVKDVMLKDNLPIVKLKTPMDEVVITMTQSAPGIAIVEDHNCLIKGVITDGDLRRAIVKGVCLNDVTAESIMCPAPITIQEDILLIDIELIANKEKIKKFIVASNNKLVGIFEL